MSSPVYYTDVMFPRQHSPLQREFFLGARQHHGPGRGTSNLDWVQQKLELKKKSYNKIQTDKMNIAHYVIENSFDSSTWLCLECNAQ